MHKHQTQNYNFKQKNMTRLERLQAWVHKQFMPSQEVDLRELPPGLQVEQAQG